MWDRVHAVLRNATALFGGVEETRSKCPRCKGSGLLVSASTWKWDVPPLSNDPCWFCEGVGTMPIIGLNGFLLARAKPAFQTSEIGLQPHLPINLQLYLSNFSETKYKFTTFKPSEDLLHSLQQESCVWYPKLSHGYIRFKSGHIQLPSPTSPKEFAENLNFDDGESGGSLAMGSPALHPAQSQSLQTTPLITLSHGASPIRLRSLLRTANRPGSSRRKRNCIREKAEKEAIDRSKWIHKSLTSCKNQAIFQSQGVWPEGLHSRNGKWEGLAGSWYERHITEGKSIPFTLSSQQLSSKSCISSPCKSWIKRLLYGRV